MQSAARASHCSHAACYSVWKKIKGQARTNPARHSEKLQPHHCSLTAHLSENKECLHLHREAGNAKQPFSLLAGVLCTCLLRASHSPAQQHWLTPAPWGQQSQNSRKVWLEKKKSQGSACLYELWSASIPFSLLLCCHLSLKLNNILSCCHVNQETLQTQKVKLSPLCWILAPGTLDGKAQYKRERTGDLFLIL